MEVKIMRFEGFKGKAFIFVTAHAQIIPSKMFAIKIGQIISLILRRICNLLPT